MYGYGAHRLAQGGEEKALTNEMFVANQTHWYMYVSVYVLSSSRFYGRVKICKKIYMLIYIRNS